jgi:tetratricopeptide (TPR) repeat protein
MIQLALKYFAFLIVPAFLIGGGSSCQSTPSEAELARQKAQEADRRGDWIAAGELWLELHLASAGADLEAAGGLARALAGQGDVDGSVHVIEAALQLDPANVKLIGQRAELELSVGRAEQAAQAYEKLLAVDPGNADAWRTLGELRLRAGDLAGASIALRQAASFPPDDPELLLLLAESSEAAGDDQVALNARMRAIQAGAGSVELWLGAGRLAAERVLTGQEPGLAALAAEWLERVIEIDPQQVLAFWYLGRLDLRRHRTDEGIANLRRTVELEPTQREALTLLAETYAEELQPKLAREFAERALALDPPVGERPRLLELAGREPEVVFVDAEAEAEAATGDPAQQ